MTIFKTLLAAAVITVPTFGMMGATVPFGGLFLPPGVTHVRFEFDPAIYPVTTQAATAAVDRWNAAFSQAGIYVILQKIPFGSSNSNITPCNGGIEFAVPDLPTSLAQCAHHSFGLYGNSYQGKDWWVSNHYVKRFRVQLNPNIATAANEDNEAPTSWEADFGYTYRTVLHEIGHALGLYHPDWCGVQVVSMMNSRGRDFPADLSSYDLLNLWNLYGTHNSQHADWYRVEDADRITNGPRRRARLSALRDSLYNSAYSKLSQASGFPNSPYLNYTIWALYYREDVVAIDGSP